MKITIISIISIILGVAISSGYWLYKLKISNTVNDINVYSLKADLFIQQMSTSSREVDSEKFVRNVELNILVMTGSLKLFELMPFTGNSYDFFIEKNKKKLNLLKEKLKEYQNKNT